MIDFELQVGVTYEVTFTGVDARRQATRKLRLLGSWSGPEGVAYFFEPLRGRTERLALGAGEIVAARQVADREPHARREVR